MEIETTYRGTIREETTETGRRVLRVELPLLFTRVVTGPTGIVDVMLTDVTIDGRSYELLGEPSLHGHAVARREPDHTVSLAGDLIRQRPVTFKPDQRGNNVLVVVFHLVPRASGPEAWPVSSGISPVSSSLRLLFTNLAPLDFEIEGELLSPSGTLISKRGRRRTSPATTNINLVGLCALVGLLLLWNWRFNTDVYAQRSTVSQEVVLAMIGSLLTFLGLSIGRIRSWLATFTDTLAVLRYPELHLSPALARGLSSGWFSAGLGLAALFAGTVVGVNWSSEPARARDLVVYDIERQTVVENRRIYREHLEEVRRFAWICDPGEGRVRDGSEDGGERREPMLLAYIGPTERVEPIWFEVEQRSAYQPEQVIRTMKMTGVEWLEDRNVEGELVEVVRGVLCGSRLERPRAVEGLVVKAVPTGNPLLTRLVVSDLRIWEAVEIDERIEEFKPEFQHLDFQKLFESRIALLERAEQDLERLFTEGDFAGKKSTVSFDVVTALTRSYLGQVSRRKIQKKAIERSLLVRALWRATAERRDRSPEEGELEEVAMAVRNLLDQSLGWRVERALTELLLDLQAQNPGASDTNLHAAAVLSWQHGVAEERYPKFCDYLVAAVGVGAVGKPQLDFLEDQWERFKLWAGPDQDIAEFVVRREATERADPVVDPSRLRTEIEELERRLETERPRVT